MFSKYFNSEPIPVKPDEKMRYRGKIIHVSDKGWGFITTPDIKFVRIFFHWTGLNPKLRFENLHKGQFVEFNVREYEDKGMRAIKIEVSDESRNNERDATGVDTDN